MTGVTGFVGRHLVPVLVAQGHEVIGIVHTKSRKEIPGVWLVVADLSRPALPDLPSTDVVVHLAQGSPGTDAGPGTLEAVNARATALLVEHARVTGAGRFVFASSGSVYGVGGTFAEDAVLPSADPYSASKIRGEHAVEAATELDTVIVRPFFPYGPGMAPHRLVADIATRVREGRAVELPKAFRLNPVWIWDVIDLMVAAIDVSGHDVWNAAGPDVVDLRELAVACGEAVGREPVFAESDAQGPGDVVGDNGRMVTALGRPAFPMRRGIRRMLAGS